MEAKIVIIKRVNIFSFKNIKNLSFDLHDGENLTIEGKNGLGKSNILNSIYWCLTGYDLNGCSDNAEFVPFHDESEDVEVEVITNVGKFARKAQLVKGSYTQEIIIDDVAADSLREGEIEIDKRLGILPFTLSNYVNKDFNLRRFLMNPSYHFGLAPKTIRDVLAKQISQDLKAQIVFNPLFTKLMEDNEIELDDPTKYYESIERLLARYESDKKTLKKCKDEDALILGFLKEHYTDVHASLINNLEYQIKETTDTLNGVEEKMMILESGKQSLNEALENAQKGTLRVELQTTTSKGTKKNSYCIKTLGISINQSSTSESIYDSWELIRLWKTSVGCNVSLPIFIDRAESINAEKIAMMKTSGQLLLTKVTTNRRIKINNCEVR